MREVQEDEERSGVLGPFDRRRGARFNAIAAQHRDTLMGKLKAAQGSRLRTSNQDMHS